MSIIGVGSLNQFNQNFNYDQVQEKQDLIANLSQIQQLSTTEREEIADFWLVNKEELCKKTQYNFAHNFFRIKRGDSGLARTILVTPERKLFVVLNRMFQDEIVGKGNFKTVKFCFEITKGTWATHTTFKNEGEREVECTVLEKLKDSPYILQLLGIDEYKSKDGSTKYSFITEYCNQGTLLDVINNNQLNDPIKQIKFFKKLAIGLYRLHAKGIIHSDIKPENIFVTEINDELIPKIADFGTAFIRNQYSYPICGTPLYFHPIQAASYIGRKSIYGPFNVNSIGAIDVWAFGAIVYYVRTEQLLPWDPVKQDISLEDRNYQGQILDNLSYFAANPGFSVRDEQGSFKYVNLMMLQANPNIQISLAEVIESLDELEKASV